MTAEAPSIMGSIPEIEGLTCQSFVCQEYRHEGVLEDPANVTFIQFQGQWFRLYFEPEMVFWRFPSEAPELHDAPEFHAEYGLRDVGAEAQIVGAQLEKLTHKRLAGGAEVGFVFSNGRTIVVRHLNDRGEISW